MLALILLVYNPPAAEVDMLAKVIYREARGVKSDSEKAAVAWCVLNRVDDERWPDTVEGVVKQRGQFAWREDTPVTEEHATIARDVLRRWYGEKVRGEPDEGRVLGREYVYFAGRDGRNWFRKEYR